MISIVARRYKDHLGRTITGGMPLGNQSDEGTYELDYRLFFGTYVSNSNPIEVTYVNGFINLITSTETWDEIGVVAGDTLVYDLQNYDGSSTLTGSATITFINGNELVLNVPIAVNFQASQGFAYVNKTPQSVECIFNLIPKDTSSGTSSIIDSSTPRLIKSSISGMAVSDVLDLVQIGTFSGSIFSATITRTADTTDAVSGAVMKNYTVSIRFVWWGYLSIFANQFLDIDCITPYVNTKFYPLFNNTGVVLESSYKPTNDGNSGFRDENFNGNPNAFQVNSFVWKDMSDNVLSTFDYSQQCKFKIEIEDLISGGFGTNFGLVFFNDISDTSLFSESTNNDNGDYSHLVHTLLGLKSDLIVGTGQTFAFTSPIDNVGYTFSAIEVAVSGVTLTITGRVNGNDEFKEKFADATLTEKDFVLLVRTESSSFSALNYSNTVNLEAFRGTAEKAPVILGEYPVVDNDLLDVNRQEIDKFDGVIILEDFNIGAIDILLEKDVQYHSVTFFNNATNTTSGDFFDMERYTIPLNPIILVDGTKPLGESTQTYLYNQLPAELRGIYDANVKIERKPSLDTSTHYGATLVFGFLQRWEDWLPQLNADVFFYPNQNKNWYNLQNIADDWLLHYGFELQIEEGSYRNKYAYSLRDYDHNADVTSSISFERLDATPITNPLIGEVVKVIAKFDTATANTLDFGDIKVEPFEASPSFWMSTFWENGSTINPLKALMGAGDRLQVSGSGTTQVTLECLFNPSGLNLQNGVSFSIRIQGTFSERKKFFFKALQLPVTPETVERGRCCECLPELKLADVDDSDLIKNDITGVTHKLNDDTETVEFKIYKDGVDLPNLGLDYNSDTAFPNDSLARGFVYNWRQYLIDYGVGNYEITKSFEVAGVDFEITIGRYCLKNYTQSNADGTARALVQFNFVSQFEQNGVTTLINFSGSGFQDSFRCRSMFGWWQPNVETQNQVSAIRENRTSKIQSKENYLYRLFDTTQCALERLHFITMHASLWRMTDHNPSNPNQKMIITDCILDKEAKEDVQYFDGSRKMGVELVLRKRTANSVSRFDGSIELPTSATFIMSESIGGGGGACLSATVHNSDDTYSTTVASGGDLELPDTMYNVYVNGILDQSFSVPSISNQTINITA